MPTDAPASGKAAMAAFRQRLHRYTTLLVAELALLLVYPFFTGFSSHNHLFRLCAIVVFSAALYAVLGKGRVTAIAILLGIPAILIRLINATTHTGMFHLADEFLGVIFMVFVTCVLVRTILSDPSVTTDTLAGAVSAYMMIGITFGLAYMLIEHLAPGSLRDTIEPGKQLLPSEFTFFSFVTLTTVGYGDIVPWLPHARSLAILESIIGIMYPALLVSRLVGLHGRKRENS